MSSNFKSQITANIGSTDTVVYTAPASTQATVIGFSLANITNGEITVTVRLQKSGPVYGHLVKNAKIPAGETLVVAGGDQKLVVSNNETLRVAANVANACDAVVSVLEIA